MSPWHTKARVAPNSLGDLGPVPPPPGPQSYGLVLFLAVLDIIYDRVWSPLSCNRLTEVLEGHYLQRAEGSFEEVFT